jgi:hypothetical protein
MGFLPGIERTETRLRPALPFRRRDSGFNALWGHEHVAFHDATGGAPEGGTADDIAIGSFVHARFSLDHPCGMADAHSAGLAELQAGNLMHQRPRQAAGDPVHTVLVPA